VGTNYFQFENEENEVKNICTGIFGYGNAARNSARVLLFALVGLAVTGIASAQANTDLRFKDGIGVIPVTGVAANGAVNLNVVRGVNPGAPWRITSRSPPSQRKRYRNKRESERSCHPLLWARGHSYRP
jgi:hypothetical protein